MPRSNASEPPYLAIVEHVQRVCAAQGFDLVHPLCIGWYNRAVDPVYRVPNVRSTHDLAMIIGNTRALWSHFLEAVHADIELASADDPLDRYTETVVREALEQVAHPYEVRFSHEPPPRRVAMQRLAHVAGLAYLSPSYLSVHPIYGPWIGLRALVVVNVPGPPGPQLQWTPPCVCESHCAARFSAALATVNEPDLDGIASHWRAWVAVRDACPVGRDHRYSEAQIEYHYVKNRRLLEPTE